MQWLAHLVARLGTHGAYANASQVLAEERELAACLDRFLLRFDHPADQARVPVERGVGSPAQVA